MRKRDFSNRADRKAILIRCDEELHDAIKAAATELFEGNMAQFSRDAIRTSMRLRQALGPRFEIEVARLLEENGRQTGAQAA